MLLRKKDKNTIVDIARNSFNSHIQLWAYGSRVNGDARDTSDLDMVLVSDNSEKIDINEFMNFKEIL